MGTSFRISGVDRPHSGERTTIESHADLFRKALRFRITAKTKRSTLTLHGGCPRLLPRHRRGAFLRLRAARLTAGGEIVLETVALGVERGVVTLRW